MTDIRSAVDGAPLDEVGHDLVTPDGLAKYKDAADALSRFKVPILVHADNFHEKMFFVAFDGTGNNKYSDPAHATNVAKIDDQLEEVNRFGRAQVLSHYVVGPGTQENRLSATYDSLRGSSYESNINNAYDEVVRQANEWMRDDPESIIRVHSIGFSRGASQVPGFARLLHDNGIPDTDSEVRGADGTVSYSRHLVEPGKTVQTVGLFDPVATGVPMNFDRRLPPSVISGFQITAADERRASFPSDQIIPLGLSEDGRFLNVMVPGAHSDVGGGYLRDGLSIRCGNFMRSYCNALRDEPYLQKELEPSDVRLNVIHQSTKGKDIFRFDPREVVRGEPSGTNERLVPRYMEHAGPTPHRSESIDLRLTTGLERQGIDVAAPSALTGSPLVAVEYLRAAGRPVPVAPIAMRVAGIATALVDATYTGKEAWDTASEGNATGAASQVVHAVSRNAAGWAGAETLMAAGAALGVESGPGMFVTGSIGGVAGFVAGDKLADAYDQYRIRHQEDARGNTWRLDDRQGWTRDVPPLPDNPHGQRLVADPILSSRLTYQASNTAVKIALATDYTPRDPFTQNALPGDTPSLREAPWVHQAQTHEWTRQVTDQRLEHGLARSHTETAGPQRAAEFDRAAERTIQQNVAESPLGVAQRYQQAYDQQGWVHHGPMPEAVAHALKAPTDKVLASDGHTYTHSNDGEWSRKGTIFGTNSADVRMHEELDASERVAQGRKEGQDTVALAHPPAAPAVPSRLDDPSHPDHAFFKQVRAHVVELDKSLDRSPDQYTDNIASALTVQARADGLNGVDRIALSSKGDALWAAQTPPERRDHLFDLKTNVSTEEANTPMEQSGAKWPEAMQQFQGHEQERSLSQQRSQERSLAESQAQAVSGPSMVR